VRTQDILVIVLPLLVAGSVALSLLTHLGGDDLINRALRPLTEQWLGLPLVLGVPILFGVLRKELSLLMLYQALGTQEIERFLDPVQLATLLLFITFYMPCISTFAVMLKSIGRRTAFIAVFLSVWVALAVSGAVRFSLLGLQSFL
jgi:ferrous iron transport protein B